MNTISVIETVLRIDDNISELWCNEKLLNALQEAQHQMWWVASILLINETIVGYMGMRSKLSTDFSTSSPQIQQA